MDVLNYILHNKGIDVIYCANKINEVFNLSQAKARKAN